MNIKGLREHQEQQKDETLKKVITAISNLKKGKKKITYKLVAEKAGVSESTLYKTPELTERIKQARDIHKKKLSGELDKGTRVRYKDSKDQKIEKYKQLLARYREENEQLQLANAMLLGNLELKTSEVIELKTRLETVNKTIDFKSIR